MSGPKTSHYTLTAEQMRILLEQMERERKINEEQVRLKKALSDIKQIKADLQAPLSNIEELQRRTGEGGEYIEETKSIVKRIDAAISQSSKMAQDVGLEKLSEQRKNIENSLKDAKNELSALGKQAVSLNIALTTDINKGVDKGFSSSFADILDNPANTPKDGLDKSKSENILNDLSRIAVLPRKYIDEISRAKEKLAEIQNADFLKNFAAMTITPLEKKCKLFTQDYQAFGVKFEELRFKYHSLCKMAEETLKEFDFSIENTKHLEQEVKRLENSLIKQKEDSYIADAIDEVMIEMGYNLMGSRNVTKKTGKRFRDELYTFSEGTAVNIRYDSEGKITMELGGIDFADRLPTDAEKDKLCGDMESFCGSFVEIEEKLKAKGVVCKNRISILPPDSEYAQIINVQDYNVSAETETVKTERRKSKTEKSKQLRNE